MTRLFKWGAALCAITFICAGSPAGAKDSASDKTKVSSHKKKHSAVEVDGIKVSRYWAREGKPNSAAFMNITNTTKENRKIVSAKASICNRCELHDHISEGDVMKMVEVKGGIELPAGKTVKLKSGGRHVMFFDVGDKMTKGSKFDLALTLDNGKVINLEVPVKKMTHRGHKSKDKDCKCCDEAKKAKA